MRLGIFGGSFDPVHYGHLLLAEICREQHQLDRVWFLPAATPPHKRDRRMTADKLRAEMLSLAIAGHDGFEVCTMELDRGGVNFTADTLESIAASQAGAELFFLMGGDSLRDLPKWRDPQRICAAATPVVMRRAGAVLDFKPLSPFVSAPRLEEISRHAVDAPLIELSSTNIRHLSATGCSIRYRTPRAVERYIATHNIYEEPQP